MQVLEQQLMWLLFMPQPRLTIPPRSLSSTSLAARSLAMSHRARVNMCEYPTPPSSRLIVWLTLRSACSAHVGESTQLHEIDKHTLHAVLHRLMGCKWQEFIRAHHGSRI